jgi:energy-coupling factor transporter transmembrane protein EcfT
MPLINKPPSVPLLVTLDPRSKLFIVFLFTILVFLINKLPTAVFLLLFLFLIRLIIRIPFHVIKIVRNLSLLAVFILLIQTLFGPGEEYILKPLFPLSFPILGGMGSLKWEGFFLGLMIVCRLGALVLILPVLTETTPAHRLAAGISALGLNYRASYVITFSLNLVPVFREEALLIMDAQKLRGGRSFEKGGFFSGIKAYAGLAVPLVLGAMRKAQISSVAMDSRAFGVYKTRTSLDKLQMKVYDFIVILVCMIFFAFLLFFNYYYV